MERAFEGDMALADARNLMMTDGVFLKNLHAAILNAFAWIEPSPAAKSMAQVVRRDGEELFRVHQASVFRSNRDSIDRALETFVNIMEALRAEMNECGPSARAKALGVS
jgi:hypothetical protein